MFILLVCCCTQQIHMLPLTSQSTIISTSHCRPFQQEYRGAQKRIKERVTYCVDVY